MTRFLLIFATKSIPLPIRLSYLTLTVILLRPSFQNVTLTFISEIVTGPSLLGKKAEMELLALKHSQTAQYMLLR